MSSDRPLSCESFVGEWVLHHALVHCDFAWGVPVAVGQLLDLALYGQALVGFPYHRVIVETAFFNVVSMRI